MLSAKRTSRRFFLILMHNPLGFRKLVRFIYTADEEILAGSVQDQDLGGLFEIYYLADKVRDNIQ
jgi:hypothetical protein